MDSNNLIQCIRRQHEQECELMNLADSMAASATTRGAQSYEQLMQTRQQFKEKLHEALSSPIYRAMPFPY